MFVSRGTDIHVVAFVLGQPFTPHRSQSVRLFRCTPVHNVRYLYRITDTSSVLF